MKKEIRIRGWASQGWSGYFFLDLHASDARKLREFAPKPYEDTPVEITVRRRGRSRKK